MKKKIIILALVSVFTAGSAFAAGYQVPEQSVDATAKTDANVASADHADAAYYNPANMSWLDNAWLMEGGLNYIHLTSIDYTDSRLSAFNGSSKEQNYLIPTIFLVSPMYDNFRLGFSITVPYGLSKSWEQPYPATFTSEFALDILEYNPTVSYKINDTNLKSSRTYKNGKGR